MLTRRVHDLELVLAELVDQQVGLVLPGHQHVTDAALAEGGRRAARARVEHRDVLVELAHELARRRLAAARLLQRVAPGREVGPARAARGLRVRRHHHGARLGQIVPVADRLGVPLAHDEHDRRRVGRAVVGQPLLPVLGDAPRLRRDGVDVVGQPQRHHVGVEAVDHRAGLLAGAAVRLADVHRLAGLLLPLLPERRVDVLVELARRIVRDVEQLHRAIRPCRARRRRSRRQHRRRHTKTHQTNRNCPFHLHRLH